MIPPFLKSGDRLQIISPASCIEPNYIEGAKKVLASWNLEISEGKFARSAYGRFAGTKNQRINDLQKALNDSSLRAILCSRGGYGLAQIIDKIDFSNFTKSPKWVIGFSDISILHAAIARYKIASLHGIMAKQLTELEPLSEPVQQLKNILWGKFPIYEMKAHPLNRLGEATGKLIGGNLSVLMGLRSSYFDFEYKNAILFIEDVGEQLYQIDRMMQNLRLSGILKKLAGLIVGQFSDCPEDPLMMQTIEEIIFEAAKEYYFPICFNFPAGHVDNNLPLIMGNPVTLRVDKSSVKVIFQNKN
ncbi:MAG TPA: LD-carboxypeptidase [Paludibacteraceae bacterium]|nr:LD-carboxypeptidase [Paludibacteraceae bacterium]